VSDDVLTDPSAPFPLEPFVRVAELENFNRFAAVNDEFVDFHMDDAAAVHKGFPRAIAMGNLTFAWLHCFVRDAFEGRGRILQMTCEFRSPVLRGDTVTCRGETVGIEKSAGGTVYDLDVWAENESGDRVTKASAKVVVGKGPED